MGTRGGTSTEMAQRLTDALDRGETVFVKELMKIVKARGVTLTAAEIGTSRFVLYRYIRRGTRRPRFEMLIKMAATCGVKFNLVPIQSRP
jgi:DNA-binding phage protein